MALRRSQPARDSGTTVIELAVALAVLGVALVAVAPALPRARAGADAAAHRIQAVILSARADAARSGDDRRLEIDLTTGHVRTYSIGEAGPDSVVSDSILPLAGDVRIVVPGGDGSWTGRFGSLGRAEAAPLIVLGSTGPGWRIMTDPWTGWADVAPE